MRKVQDRHKEENKETLVKVILSNLFSLLKILLVCLVLVYFITNYLAKPVRVYQESMTPTIKDGTIALGNAFVAHFLDIERFDVVVAQDKSKSPYYIVKRVIGLPGDRVSAKDDVVYVNGKAIEEPYLNTNYVREWRYFNGSFTDDFDEVLLSENEYFLLGDNRPVSHDSREMGAFKKSTIKACGLWKVYSPKG